MKKVFIDTNVVLDFILEREGEQAATDILELSENKKINLYASYLTMANAAYVAKKHRTPEELQTYLSLLTPLFKVLTNDEEQYLKALEHPVVDFEDCLQYVCAKTFDCDVIITNNVKHFADSPVPVQTPAEFLASL